MESGIISRHPEDRDVATLYRLLVQNLTDFAIFMTDPDGIITTWNPGVEHNLGYAEKEFIGQSFSILFRREDIEAGAPRRELDRAVAVGRAPDVRWHVRKDGSALFIDGVVVPLRDESGKLLGFSKVMRDATDRKLAEESMERSRRELMQFPYVVAHDLQAPLRAISVYTEMLTRSRENPDAGARDYAGFIQTGVQQMQKLIQDLLEYSRVSQEQVPLKCVDLNQVFDRSLATFRPLIEETKAEVRRDKLPEVKAGETHLVQLFQNLIGNALKYRGEQRPKVHVSAAQNGTGWKIAVRDNGIGIEEQFIAQIFEPFKRLHSGSVPGSGIGLATCKMIVERYGGRIWVESKPGGGSTFYFTLPDE